MIQNLIRAVTIDATTGSRVVVLVVVANGHVEVGDLDGVARVDGGTNLFSASARPQAAVLGQKVYFVDGVGIPKQLNLDTKTIVTFVPTVTVPVNVPPSNCRLCCPWRDRLFLGAPDASPTNFHLSRSGDAHDFNVSAKDPAGAFSRVVPGVDRLVAAIPFRDDVLILGGDQTLKSLVGDPKAGGEIMTVSDQVGVLGPDAWTQDPHGNIYFVGTGGLHRMQADGGMRNLSAGRLNSFFKRLDRAAYHIELEWDRDRHGLWVYATAAGEQVSQHLWWDARTDGFFPMEFPIAHGPTASLVFDGDAPDDRLLLLGGRDGVIRLLDEDRHDDDGDPIVSEVNLGPYLPGGVMAEAKMLQIDATLGDDPDLSPDLFRLDYAVRVGEDPLAAMTNPSDENTGSWTAPGRQDGVSVRLAGRAFMVRLHSQTLGTTWSMDDISAKFGPAGRAR